MSGMIEFKCPHPECGKAIQTDARYVGQQGPCPHCGKSVTVEAPAGQVFEPAPQHAPQRASTGANMPRQAGTIRRELKVPAAVFRWRIPAPPVSLLPASL